MTPCAAQGKAPRTKPSTSKDNGSKNGTTAVANVTKHVPGQVQLEGKKLTNRDLTTVLTLLREEGFVEEDFRFLNLSQNHLDHLPTNIPNQVQALHLGQNRFTALIGFELLQELECLDASRNLLQRSWGLAQNFNLRHLNLAGNKIHIVEGLESLRWLETLDLSNNLIRRFEDMRSVSLNGALRSVRLRGNPIASLKHYRFNVHHLLPFVRLLDGEPFLPFARDPREGGGGQQLEGEEEEVELQPSLTAHECTYADIHLSKQLLYRRFKRKAGGGKGRREQEQLMNNKPAAPALEREPAEPPRRRYTPSWRCPPNPLPRGWKDYRQLAKDSMVRPGERRSPSKPSWSPIRKREPSPPPRLRPHGQELDDWAYARCPEPNTFSYNYLVIPRPASARSSSPPPTSRTAPVATMYLPEQVDQEEWVMHETAYEAAPTVRSGRATSRAPPTSRRNTASATAAARDQQEVEWASTERPEALTVTNASACTVNRTATVSLTEVYPEAEERYWAMRSAARSQQAQTSGAPTSRRTTASATAAGEEQEHDWLSTERPGAMTGASEGTETVNRTATVSLTAVYPEAEERFWAMRSAAKSREAQASGALGRTTTRDREQQQLEAAEASQRAGGSAPPPAEPARDYPRSLDTAPLRSLLQGRLKSKVLPRQRRTVEPPPSAGEGTAISSLSSPDAEYLAPVAGDGDAGAEPSPGSSATDGSFADDGSREMREIIKMLRDLLVQKRKTIELLMKSSSEAGSESVSPI